MRNLFFFFALAAGGSAFANATQNKIECRLYTRGNNVLMSMLSNGPDGFRFDGSSDGVYVEGTVKNWNRVTVKLRGYNNKNTAATSEVTPVTSLMLQTYVDTSENRDGEHATVICRVSEH